MSAYSFLGGAASAPPEEAEDHDGQDQQDRSDQHTGRAQPQPPRKEGDRR